MTLTLKVSDIYYTQDSISEQFGDRGNGEVETLEKTFKELLYGDVHVGDLRPLSVVLKDGKKWVVSGNRRLYVYKQLNHYGRLEQVTVNSRPINPQRVGRLIGNKNVADRPYKLLFYASLILLKNGIVYD